MTVEQAKKRLEELRVELQAERISTGELLELQGLKGYIDSGDVELLEAAGVPEHSTRVTRQQAIDRLVDQGYDAFNTGELSLDELLRHGFEGYNNRDNATLEENYNEGLDSDEMIWIAEVTE